MSFYKKMKSALTTKRDEDAPLSRKDLAELEKIIRASKKALSKLRIDGERKYGLKCENDAEDQESDSEESIDESFQDEDNEDLSFADDIPEKSANGGVAFEVEFEPAKRTKTLSNEVEKEPPKPLLEYTSEEKSLMAEIIREDFLSERATRAANTDVKRYDANRRRKVKTAQIKAKMTEQVSSDSDTARDIEVRSKKLNKLAAKAKEARLAAASKRELY